MNAPSTNGAPSAPVAERGRNQRSEPPSSTLSDDAKIALEDAHAEYLSACDDLTEDPGPGSRWFVGRKLAELTALCVSVGMVPGGDAEVFAAQAVKAPVARKVAA